MHGRWGGEGIGAEGCEHGRESMVETSISRETWQEVVAVVPSFFLSILQELKEHCYIIS